MSVDATSKKLLLQFVNKRKLPAPKKHPSLLIPSAHADANRAHPFQRRLVPVAPEYQSYLPGKKANPFASAPVFWPTAPADREAIDAAIACLARRIGAGTQIFIVVDNEVSPNDPTTFNIDGIQDYAAADKAYVQQRLQQLYQIAQSFGSAQEIIASKKDVETVLKQQVPDEAARTHIRASIAFLRDGTPMPAGLVDPDLMQSIDQGRKKQPDTKEYITVDTTDSTHEEIFASSKGMVPPDQSAEIKTRLNVTDPKHIQQINAFCRKHHIILSNLFKHPKKTGKKASRGIAILVSALRSVAEKTLDEKAEQDLLCKIYNVASKEKSKTAAGKVEDAVMAINQYSHARQSDDLTDEHFARLLREQFPEEESQYKKGDATKPNKVISHVMLNFADFEKLRTGLKDAITEDLKKHFAVLADPASDKLTPNTNTVINYMLKIGEHYYELQVRLNYNAGRYHPSASLRDVVAKSANEQAQVQVGWNTVRDQIHEAIKAVPAGGGLTLDPGYRPDQLVQFAKMQEDGTSILNTPLVLAADWMRTMNSEHRLAKCRRSGLAGYCAEGGYSKADQQQLLLSALETLVDPKHKGNLSFTKDGGIYSAAESLTQRSKLAYDQQEEKKEGKGIQMMYHAFAVDADEAAKALEGDLINKDTSGNYSMTYRASGEEVVFVRKAAAAGDGVRYSLEGKECKTKAQEESYLERLARGIVAEHIQCTEEMEYPEDYQEGLIFDIARHDFKHLSNDEIAKIFFKVEVNGRAFAKIRFTDADPVEEITNEKYNRPHLQKSKPLAKDEKLPVDLKAEAVNTADNRNDMVDSFDGIQRDGFAEGEAQHSPVYCLLEGISKYPELVNAKLQNALDSREAEAYIKSKQAEEEANGNQEFSHFLGLVENLPRRVFWLLCKKQLPAAGVIDPELDELHAAFAGLQLPNDGSQETALERLDAVVNPDDDVEGYDERFLLTTHRPAKEILGSEARDLDKVVGLLHPDSNAVAIEDSEREENRKLFEAAAEANKKFTGHKPGPVARVKRAAYGVATGVAEGVVARVPQPVADAWHGAMRVPAYALSPVLSTMREVYNNPLTGTYGLYNQFIKVTGLAGLVVAVGGVTVRYVAAPIVRTADGLAGGRIGNAASAFDATTGSRISGAAARVQGVWDGGVRGAWDGVLQRVFGGDAPTAAPVAPPPVGNPPVAAAPVAPPPTPAVQEAGVCYELPKWLQNGIEQVNRVTSSVAPVAAATVAAKSIGVGTVLSAPTGIAGSAAVGALTGANATATAGATMSTALVTASSASTAAAASVVLPVIGVSALVCLAINATLIQNMLSTEVPASVAQRVPAEIVELDDDGNEVFHDAQTGEEDSATKMAALVVSSIVQVAQNAAHDVAEPGSRLFSNVGSLRDRIARGVDWACGSGDRSPILLSEENAPPVQTL